MKIYKTTALVLLAAGCAALPAIAEPTANDAVRPVSKLSIDTRADYTYQDIEHQSDNQSGFHGRYLNVRMDGELAPQLTYSWRQRLNKFQNADNDIFTATDWIYLDYRINQQWSVSGGKQVVLIGGYEYDAAPIDIFFASRFWNNIACYQFGASASYHSADDTQVITAQVCNSPYQPTSSGCYAYNLYWSGQMGWLKTLWSVNMIEYERGQFANFIALGNHATFGALDLQLDLMNRATKRHKYWGADYSIIAKAEYAVSPCLTLMAKGGKDDFRALPGAPEHQNNPFYGAGVKVYPLNGSRDLRLHAIADVFHDNNGVRTSEINIGLTWRVNIIK